MALAYQAPFDVNSELTVWKGDFASATLGVRKAIEFFMQATNTRELKVALSDTDGNYRRMVYSRYKAHRLSTTRPLMFKRIRDFLKSEYGAVVEPGLEGDDVVSIWATAPDADGVVCSIDKDLKGTPCWLFNPNKGHVEIISHDDAERFFISQVLTGDRTDGYPGIPSIGPKRCADAMEDVPTADLWEKVVVPMYEKAGLAQWNALENARCARLLRFKDFGPGKVRLWTPDGAGQWQPLQPSEGIWRDMAGRVLESMRQAAQHRFPSEASNTTPENLDSI